MPLPRYARKRSKYAGPRTSRALLVFYAVLAAIGVLAGLAWTTLNLWQTQVGR